MGQSILDWPTTERKEHFQQMGNQFRSVFSNIGNTKQGRDYKSVVHILGMSLLR